MSHVMPVYGRAALSFEKGEGSYLYTKDGEKYLDFASGVAVLAFGHSHPHMVKKLKEQAETLWHCSNLFEVSGQERVATRLCENSFAEQVFFCNSGTEAIEACLKVVRKYKKDQGKPKAFRVIGCDMAFHGRTFGAMAATGQEKILKGFEPELKGFDRAIFNDIESIRAQITDETAGIIVEPVQGEGGVRAADKAFLQGLRDLADEHDLLLIFDEVQCGMGRTGKLFAHEWSGVTPDVMALAKGLGGGFPVGACLATTKASKSMTAGSHGSTFGGNPLAMAATEAVLDLMLEDGFLESVQDVSAYLTQQLESIVSSFPDLFVAVRGAGLMRGLEAKKSNTDVMTKCRDKKLLLTTSGQNVVRFLPPLNISKSEIDEAIAIFRTVCEELNNG
ncbi:MAG: aspartate aminotransferase family protein [Alphaproteobacteria bacterium]